MEIPKYKRMTDLTDEDIRCLMFELFKSDENQSYTVTDIDRDKKFDTISCTLITKGIGDDGKPFEYEDIIDMEMPSMFEDGIGTHSFTFTNEEITKYQQFIFAKGCDWRFKDNPYL